MFRSLAIAAATLTLTSCATMAPPAETVAPVNVAKGWITTADGQQRLAQLPPAPFGAATGADVDGTLTIDTAQRFQTVQGFGAAVTDASAYLIDTKLTPEARAALLRDLFGRDGGIGLNTTRLTIGASDFSKTHYSYDDMPRGQRDPDLAHFSIAPAREHLIPVLRQILAVDPALTIVASPWSAPGWMKTTDSLIKGRLRKEAYPAFAHYLDRYVQAMADEGIPVEYLTIQNEPHFEPENYPGMRVEPDERAAFVGGYLGPLLAERGRGTQILDWDHNWDQPESPLGMLADAKAARYVDGIAWHCYNGDVSAQSKVHRAYPGKSTWFTECSGGGWSPGWDEGLKWTAGTLVIGTLNNWAEGVVIWNLALDENSGPHKGGCGDCRGVVTIDSATGKVTRNVEYYALAHASRFAEPGAQRVATNGSIDGVAAVTLRNPSDADRVLILFNGANKARMIAVADGERRFALTIPAGAVETWTWQAPER